MRRPAPLPASSPRPSTASSSPSRRAGTPWAATEPWDGGDIDHTAAYADRIFTPGSQELFILGQPTALDVEAYADTHTGWLTANRGCATPAATSEGTLDGRPARLLEIHCPEGIFGPTLVLKAVAVAQGQAVIVTSFTPDGNVARTSPPSNLWSSRWPGDPAADPWPRRPHP